MLGQQGDTHTKAEWEVGGRTLKDIVDSDPSGVWVTGGFQAKQREGLMWS